MSNLLAQPLTDRLAGPAIDPVPLHGSTHERDGTPRAMTPSAKPTEQLEAIDNGDLGRAE